MGQLYSLVDPPPPGFVLVTEYRRRDFRTAPFALHAESIAAAARFIERDFGSLWGILVFESELSTEFSELAPCLYQLRANKACVQHLQEQLTPLLLLLANLSQSKDEGYSAQLERNRSLLNQQRMADEFENVRTSLLRELLERRLATERIHENERKIRSLLDSAFGLIGLLDPDGHVLDVNRTSLDFAGVTLEQIRGRLVWETPLWPQCPETQHTIREAIALALNGVATRVEVTLQNRQGSEVDLDVSLKPNLDDDGRVEFLVAEAWDVSVRKQAERSREMLQARLMQTQRLESIGRLAGGVAHDFNNMLGVILGRAELALSEIEPGTPTYEDVQEIRKTAERSAQLTRQLLAFARRQTISPKAVNLNEAVSNLTQIFSRLLGDGQQLQWLPAPILWQVKVDSGQFDLLLTNLVENARDALQDQGTVTLSTCNQHLEDPLLTSSGLATPGDYVVLSVKDTGIGMTEEAREHLFEPFYTTKRQRKGSGMGLATVLGIVGQHQGFVDVQSSPGEGTEVLVYLPRMGQHTIISAAENDRETPLPEQPTVLVVEDEPSLLALQERMLKSLGYRVLTAGSPAEALSLLADSARQIDLLITDVIMPSMNGRELAERLVATRPGLRCLFMSGYTANVIASEGVLDGSVNFIQKPFTLAQMAQKVVSVLASPPGRVPEEPSDHVVPS